MTSKAVETVFSAVDKISPAFNRMQNAANKFSVGAKAAVKAVLPQVKALDDITKGVTFGNLLSSGIMAAGKQIKSIVQSVPDFANRADEIGKTAQMLGLTTDALQRYRYAASLANVDQGTLNTSFRTMLRNISSPSFFKSLSNIDKGLADQMKSARSSSEAFRIAARVINGYEDAGKKAAAMNAIFGRSGTALIPMLGDLENQLRNANDLIDGDMINTATDFNDTINRIKRTMAYFAGIIQGAVLEYITPLIKRIEEWTKANQELIKTKLEEFMGKVYVYAQKLFSAVQTGIRIIEDFGIAILGGYLAIKTWMIIDAVNKSLTVFKAAQTAATVATNAQTAATKGATLAHAVFNAVVKKNPIGLILAGVVLLITAIAMGIKNLAGKVGGLGNAFKVIGQTIMKCLLTPINLAMDGIKALLRGLSFIPGVNLSGAVNSIQNFQDSMNTRLTGSTSTLTNSGVGFLADPYRNARNAELERQSAAAGTVTVDNTGDEIVDQLGCIRELLGEGNDLVAGLGEQGSQTNPASLRWRAAGIEDYWGTARAGI